LLGLGFFSVDKRHPGSDLAQHNGSIDAAPFLFG
jgi:hypothetical protein